LSTAGKMVTLAAAYRIVATRSQSRCMPYSNLRP
jgi:hypothetical protein